MAIAGKKGVGIPSVLMHEGEGLTVTIGVCAPARVERRCGVVVVVALARRFGGRTAVRRRWRRCLENISIGCGVTSLCRCLWCAARAQS